MLNKKLSIIGVLLCVCGIGLSLLTTPKQVKEAEAISYIDIDAGPIYDVFIKPWNQDNGFFFNLKENTAPYGNYTNFYRPTTEENIKIKRNGITYNACKFDPNYLDRDTVYKLSPTEYSLNVSSGWFIKEEYLPLRAGDEIFISGIFIHSRYRVNITESSFLLDEERLVSRSNVIEEDLTITGNLNLEGKDKITFDTNKNKMNYMDSGWPEFYAADVNNNLTVCRDLTSFNKKTLLYPKNATEWQVTLNPDFDSANNYTPINGDLLYFGGKYYNDDYVNDTSYRFTLDNGLFLINEKDGIYSISSVTDPGTLLLNKMQDLVDIDIYTGESQRIILDAFHEFKEMGKNPLYSFKELWDKYVEIVSLLKTLPIDKEAELLKLTELRNNGINSVVNFVSLDNYLPEEANLIIEKQNEIIPLISVANNREEVDSLVKEYKDYVLSLKNRKDIYTATVLKNNPKGSYVQGINDQYLAKYDVVSVADLGLDKEIKINAEPSLRAKNIDTDISYDNTFDNTFPVSKDNFTNSVVFKFDYTVSANNLRMSIAIKLRGIRYCGYKFMLSDSNYGVFFKRTPKVEPEKFLGGKENLFTTSGTYHCEIGAIDILNTDQVYLYMICNNLLVESLICDRLPFNHNRIDIRPENIVSTSGSATLSTVDTQGYLGTHLGRFDVHENRDQVINLSAEANDIPFDSNKTIETFPLREDCVRLVRGEETTSVAKTNVPLMYKYTEYLYALNTNAISDTFLEGDKLIFEGNFASFNSVTSEKLPFFVSKTILVYKNGLWEKVPSTLEEEKEDALYKLNNYGNPLDYTEEDYLRLQEVLSEHIEEIYLSTSIEEVRSLLNSSLGKADNILTIIQKYRNNTIELVNLAVNSIKEEYFEDEQNELFYLRDQYNLLILASDDEEEIDNLYFEFLTKISQISTKEEKTLEELFNAKDKAITNIREYYCSCNVDSLSNKKAKEVNDLVLKAINDIENSIDIEEINKINQETITYLTNTFASPNFPTINLPLILGVSIGGGVILIGAIVLIIVISKKKKATK